MTDLTSPTMSRRAALKGGLATTLSLPTMAVALAACSSEQVALTSDYAALIEKVSDLVIPQTDTQGALAAGVPDYVRAVVGAFLTEEEQAAFKSGLSAFDKLAHEEKAESFLAASPEQQFEILSELDSGEAESAATATWRRLKDMVVFGYYTSEAATEELAYEEIPGRYVGDIPFQEVGRAWLEVASIVRLWFEC